MKCNHCEYEYTNSKIGTCPNCGNLLNRRPASPFPLVFLIILVVGLAMWYEKTGSPEDVKSSKVADTVRNPPVCNPIEKYGADQFSSAQKRLVALRQNYNIVEEGSHLVVTLKSRLPEKEMAKTLVTLVADADAIVNCEARFISVYDVNGKKIAQADPISGIQVVD